MRLRRTVDLYPIFWKNVQRSEYLVPSKKAKGKIRTGIILILVVKTVRSIKLPISFSPFKILEGNRFCQCPLKSDPWQRYTLYL